MVGLRDILGPKGGFLMENEKKYLRKVLDLVDYRINDNQQRINVLMESLKRGIDDENAMYSVEETYIGMYIRENISLKRHQDSPYFARIDFKEETDKESKKYYLGKVGLIDDNANQYIVDWRSPIANLYYDSALGTSEYKTKRKRRGCQDNGTFTRIRARIWRCLWRKRKLQIFPMGLS